MYARLTFADILREERLREYNRCHNPAGSPAGGQFCAASGLDLRFADAVAFAHGKPFAVHRTEGLYTPWEYRSPGAANPEHYYKSLRSVKAAVQRGEARRRRREGIRPTPAGRGRKAGWSR